MPFGMPQTVSYMKKTTYPKPKLSLDWKATKYTALPGLIWFMFFLIIPLLIVLGFSFLKRGDFGTVLYELDFSNYKRVLEPLYLKIVLRSLWLAVYTTGICLLLAYPLAYHMARTDIKTKQILLALIIIPFWINFIIRIYALKLVLGESGIINHLLLELNILQEPLQLTDNALGVGIGMIYNYFPFMVLPLFVSLEKLDYTLLDAAYDLGANKRQVITKILLPLSLPGMFTGCMFVFIPSFGEFVIPDLLGGSQTMFVGNLITETFLKTRDWPFGSALSALLVLMSMAAFMFVLHRVSAATENVQDINATKHPEREHTYV